MILLRALFTRVWYPISALMYNIIHVHVRIPYACYIVSTNTYSNTHTHTRTHKHKHTHTHSPHRFPDATYGISCCCRMESSHTNVLCQWCPCTSDKMGERKRSITTCWDTTIKFHERRHCKKFVLFFIDSRLYRKHGNIGGTFNLAIWLLSIKSPN